MLTISDNAAEVIKVILLGGDSPEGAGLRIAPAAEGIESGGLQAAITSEPAQDDEVVEEAGVRVFLEPRAAELLGDKTLDAERDDNGELALAVRD